MRIMIKTVLTTAQEWGDVCGRITVIGSRSVISTSNTRKITAIRKNCRENGVRAEALGSNPHSNGEGFSRSSLDFFDSSEAIIITAVDRIIHSVVIVSTLIIICSFSVFLIGSQMYIYTKHIATSSVD